MNWIAGALLDGPVPFERRACMPKVHSSFANAAAFGRRVVRRTGRRELYASCCSLYDIHANLPALEAVLEAVERAHVDCIVVGGDVLPGPMPRETLARLQELSPAVHFIHGNGDREVLARLAGVETEWYRSAKPQWRAPIDWTAEQLDAGQQQWMSSWPASCRVKIAEHGEVLFCHATPRSDTELFTRQTPEAALVEIFRAGGSPLVVCGHTHMQFDRRIGGVRVVNAGSVGMPFGEAGAYWLLFEPELRLQKTRLDLEQAARRIRATKYPDADDFASNGVLEPPGEAQMLKLYAGSELS
jgi:putative phosphoesterase